MLTDEQKDAFLKKLYYDEKNFVGRDKLYYLVSKTLGNKEITRRYLMISLNMRENQRRRIAERKQAKNDVIIQGYLQTLIKN